MAFVLQESSSDNSKRINVGFLTHLQPDAIRLLNTSPIGRIGPISLIRPIRPVETKFVRKVHLSSRDFDAVYPSVFIRNPISFDWHRRKTLAMFDTVGHVPCFIGFFQVYGWPTWPPSSGWDVITGGVESLTVPDMRITNRPQIARRLTKQASNPTGGHTRKHTSSRSITGAGARIAVNSSNIHPITPQTPINPQMTMFLLKVAVTVTCLR